MATTSFAVSSLRKVVIEELGVFLGEWLLMSIVGVLIAGAVFGIVQDLTRPLDSCLHVVVGLVVVGIAYVREHPPPDTPADKSP